MKKTPQKLILRRYKMIQITSDAIDRVMEDSYDAHKQGKMMEFLASIDKRIENEQPFLRRYIDAGHSIIIEAHSGDEGKDLSAGYSAACEIVFRFVDKQCKLSNLVHPTITQEDIDRTNDRASLREEMHGGGKMLERRIIELTTENEYFGQYLYEYVSSQAPSELIARGFAMGAIGTYSVYEQAFARVKNSAR